MPTLYNRNIREKLKNIYEQNCCLHKKIMEWLKDKQCCNNVYTTEDKVCVVAFKNNLVVCREFENMR